MHSDDLIVKLDQTINRFEGLLERYDGSSQPVEPFLADEYEKALRDAVQVLDRTKNSFKSKQLKELRERIEAVLALKQ